jgi:integrase
MKGKEGPLEIRVTVSRRVYYINTKVKVRAQEWRFGRVVNRDDADELTHRVELLLARTNEEIDKCIERRQPIDVKAIGRAIWGNVGSIGTSFLDWYEEQMEMMNVAEGTKKHYRTTLARLRACGIIRCWEDVTVENIFRWDAWLHGLKKTLTDEEVALGIKAKPLLCDGSVWSQHKNLKHILYRAVKMGKLDVNPYIRLHGEFPRGDKETFDFLTEAELERIMELEPDDAMMRTARDLFIFQSYTGLSYSDAQAFDIKDYKEINGRWINTGERVKTGVPYVSMLLPPAVDVLKRHGMMVPKLSNQKYNQALKAIGFACGINTRMHTHLARHTFATMVLRNGAKVENVQRMLGHRKIEQTLRYAKVVAQSVHEDFEMIAEKMARTKKKKTKK